MGWSDIESLFGNIKVQEINLYKKSRKMEVKVISDRLYCSNNIEIEENLPGIFA